MNAWKKAPIPLNALTQVAIESKRQIFSSGLILFINYPLYYFIWLNIAGENFENLLLRLTASALCLPLIFNKYWPKQCLHWLTIYWYTTICYCLPFFFTFMLLKNNANTLWLMNLVSATFFAFLLFDVITSLALLLMGSLAAYLAFVLSGSVLSYPAEGVTLGEIAATFIAVIIIGSVFSRNKQTIEEMRRLSIKAAEESSRTKTEFLANMSHDIRTPLTGIIGLSANLRETFTNPKSKESISMIYLCSEQLLSLLNGVLEVISLETVNDSTIVQEPFDVFTLIDDLIQLEKPAAQSHNLVLRKSLDENTPRHCIGDKMKLHRILLNLIGNAIKFTEQGCVEISTKLISKNKDKAVIEFRVTDTGIGIPEEAQQNIFERFYKVNPSYKGKYNGNGLGLHIVQRYVKLLQGEIGFHSKTTEGSTFFVTLTFSLATSSSPIEKESIKETIPTFLKEKTTLSLQKNIELTEETLNRKKILLIEDNIAALMGLKYQVKAFGVIIHEAKDGEAGLELIKKHSYDLIITDIGLPGISGDEMVRQARAFEQAIGRTPSFIIALTGHAKDGKFEETCRDAGINEIYLKPMTHELLAKIMRPIMGNSGEKPIREMHPKKLIISSPLGLDLQNIKEIS